MFTAHEKTVLVVAVAIFFIFMILYAFYFYRSTKTYDDYNVAGRSVSFFPYVLTIVGTAVGGSTLLGFMEKGFEKGLGQIWLQISSAMTGIIFVLFFVKRIRKIGEKHHMVSIGDYTALRYGESARFPTLISTLCAYCGITGMQFIAVATILQLVFGLDLFIGTLIGWALLTLKTYFGGLKAVIWSDAVLGTLQTLGIFMLFFIVYVAVGKWDGISDHVEAVNRGYALDVFHIPTTELVVYFLTIGAYQFVRQDLWQRFWAAKDVKTTLRGYWAGIIISFFIGVAVILLGVFADVGLQLHQVDPQLIYYGIIKETLPLSLIVVMIIALLATVISTADSFCMAGASSIANDIIKPRMKEKNNSKMLKFSRFSVILMSVCSLLLAIYIPRLVELWITGTAMLVSGLLAPVMVGLVWKGATKTAGLVAMWGGLIIAVTWQILDHPFGIHPVLIGLPLSVVLLFIVSLFTNNQSVSTNINISID